jgi:hypothetical protein
LSTPVRVNARGSGNGCGRGSTCRSPACTHQTAGRSTSRRASAPFLSFSEGTALGNTCAARSPPRACGWGEGDTLLPVQRGIMPGTLWTGVGMATTALLTVDELERHYFQLHEQKTEELLRGTGREARARRAPRAHKRRGRHGCGGSGAEMVLRESAAARARMCGRLMARRRCASALPTALLTLTSCCLISSLAFPCASLRHSTPLARLLIDLSSCFATHMSPFNDPFANTRPHPHIRTPT